MCLVSSVLLGHRADEIPFLATIVCHEGFILYTEELWLGCGVLEQLIICIVILLT